MKKLIAFLCMLAVSVTTLFGSFMVAFADDDDGGSPAEGKASDSILSTYIRMAAGEQSTNIKGKELTADTTRFLGVYVSNFYVPFATELGIEGTDSTTKTTKADIKSALQKNLAFDDSSAEALSENLMGLMRSNKKNLVAYESDDPLKLGKPLNIDVNAYTFTQAMLGFCEPCKKKYIQFVADSKVYFNARVTDIKGSKLGSVIPVQEQTPAQFAFIKCMDRVDPNNGYGTSFFDLTQKDADNDATEKIFTKTDGAKMASTSVLGTQVAVTCFGDILFLGGNHQIVAVPGCMNPFTWVGVNADGDDTIGAGGFFNGTNLISMSMNSSLADTFSLVGQTDSNVASEVKDSFKFRNDKWLIKRAFESNPEDAISALNKAIDQAGGGATATVEESTIKIKITDKSRASKLKIENIRKPNEKSVSKEAVKEAVKYIKQEAGERLGEVSKAKKNKDISGSVNLFSARGKIGATKDTVVTQKELVGSEKAKDVLPYGDEKSITSSSYIPLREFRGTTDTTLKDGTNLLVFKTAGDMGKATTKIIEHHNKKNKAKCVTYPSSAGGFNPCYVIGTPMDTVNGMYINATMIYVDDLGAFKGGGKDFKTLNALPLIKDSAWNTGDENAVHALKDSYGSVLKELDNPKLNLNVETEGETLVGLFFTYAFAGANDNASKKETCGKLGFRINDDLPSINKTPLHLTGSEEDEMTASIRSWLYYFLHPTKGFRYVTTLIKNKMNALLVSWHEDMVGSNGVGNVVGTTTYRNTTGYVTLPSMADSSFGQTMQGIWNSALIYLGIGIVVIVILSWIIGIMSPQKAFSSAALACILLLLPGLVLNNVMTLGNSVADKIYGDKFTYWALVQSESYTDKIDEAANGDSYSNYLRTLYQTNSESKANQGSESIVVKWQAPKKMTSLMLTNGEEKALQGVEGLIKGIINKTYSGENYVDTKDYAYLYRSYLDIQNFSRYIYRGTADGTKPVYKTINNAMTGNWNADLRDSIQNFDVKYKEDRDNGYCNPNGDGSAVYAPNMRGTTPLSSGVINDALGQKGTLKDLKQGQFVGVPRDAFKFSIPMYNQENLKFVTELGDSEFFNASKYTEEDLAALGVYGLYTESSYYYFSWCFYEMGMSPETSSTDGFKKVVLNSPNAGFFYNTKGNGELKDFVDMRTLFTNIIPYLKQGNDIVHEWDDLYGIYLHDGVPYEEGMENDPDIKGNPELEQKYWHNVNVARLYGLYTPWVDIMYNCSYAKPEKIKVMGHTVTVDDPINPASYPKERPMIFSKSEMVDFGLKKGDLTKVERKIIEAEEGMQKRLFEMLNYHSFNDVTLNSAAAMSCTFEFNKAFSEGSILNNNKVLLPQSFTLSDFSYDAYLRMILSNSTGEKLLQKDGSFYENIVKKSSTTTAILLIVNDILAQYAVPGVKQGMIYGLFALFALMVATLGFRLRSNKQARDNFVKNGITPLIKLVVYSLVFSLVVSWFMGKGNDAVTQTGGESIQVGDPASTLLLMVVINTAFVIVMGKLLIKVLKDIKVEGKLAGGFVGSVLQGVAGAIGKGFKSATKGLQGESSGGGSGSAGSGKGGSAPNQRATSRTQNHASYGTFEPREKKSEGEDKKARKVYKRKDTVEDKTADSNRRQRDIDNKSNEGINRLNRRNAGKTKRAERSESEE